MLGNKGEDENKRESERVGGRVEKGMGEAGKDDI